MTIFTPPLAVPPGTRVFDLSRGPIEDAIVIDEVARNGFGIGRYAERRPGVYHDERYLTGGAGPRDTHVGIDVFARAGTEVRALAGGQIHLVGYNGLALDYGATVITRHRIEAPGGGHATLYALHGHLARRSLEGKAPGQPIARGEVIGWLGERDENGGWVPHLHLQLSWAEPLVCDLPGAVRAEDLAAAMLVYPDPCLVLGPIY